MYGIDDLLSAPFSVLPLSKQPIDRFDPQRVFDEYTVRRRIEALEQMAGKSAAAAEMLKALKEEHRKYELWKQESLSRANSATAEETKFLDKMDQLMIKPESKVLRNKEKLRGMLQGRSKEDLLKSALGDEIGLWNFREGNGTVAKTLSQSGTMDVPPPMNTPPPARYASMRTQSHAE